MTPRELIQARVAAGVTQLELAEACGYTERTIDQYETSKLRISNAIAAQLLAGIQKALHTKDGAVYSLPEA